VVDCRQQQNDEIPMVWVMLVYIYVLYSPGWNHKVSMPTLLVPYGAIFSVLHNHYQFVTGFQAPLHVTSIAVCTTDLQILHSHNKHAGTPLGTPVFILLLFHNHLLVC